MEREFLTIQEITALAKRAGLQSDTMKAWRIQAKRQPWNELGEGVYRIIDGKPAYHVSVLSERLRRFVRPPKPDANAMKIRRGQDMQAARKEVLTAIDVRAEAAGKSWREVALEFIAALDEAAHRRAPPHARAIVGFNLPYTVMREAKGWVSKGGSWRVSLASLYEWRNHSSKQTTTRSEPATTGAAGSFEKGFRAASEFIWSSPDVVLEHLVASDEARFVEIMRRRGYQIERVQSEPVQSGS